MFRNLTAIVHSSSHLDTDAVMTRGLQADSATHYDIIIDTVIKA